MKLQLALILLVDTPPTIMVNAGTRDCWNFIEFFKKGRLIMLVTHSMEEAEYSPTEIKADLDFCPIQ